MQIKNILCPVDFSPPSDDALQVASSIAREKDAKLWIVHVLEHTVDPGPGWYGRPPHLVEVDCPELFKTLPNATDVTFEHDLLVGEAGHEIVRFAEEKQIDLIIMGCHGQTGIAAALMGSVSEAVVRNSPVPVLSLKSGGRKLSGLPEEIMGEPTSS